MPDTSGFSADLTSLSPRDKPWEIHRAEADKIQKLYQRLEYDRYAERMETCSQRLGFILEAKDEGEMRYRLREAHFCRCRHCAICQWRRMLKWRARFFAALPKIHAAYPTARWLFLTLTVKNCPLEELRDTVNHLNQSWKKLTHYKQFPAIGWVKSLEVTRADDDLAHPHLHCLLMVSPSYFRHGYLKHADWTRLWRKAAKLDYEPMVNVKAIQKPRSGKITFNEAGIPEAMLSAVLEALKYSVKPSDFLRANDPDQNAEWLGGLTRALHKTRSTSIGGALRNFLDDSEPDDLITIDEAELTQSELEQECYWFLWKTTFQKYLYTGQH